MVISSKKISPCLGHGVIILGSRKKKINKQRPKLGDLNSKKILEIHVNPQGCGILRWCRGPLRFCRTRVARCTPIKEMKRCRLKPSLHVRILLGLTKVQVCLLLCHCTYIEYSSMLYLFHIKYWYDSYAHLHWHFSQAKKRYLKWRYSHKHIYI